MYSNLWLQHEWPADWVQVPIAPKEPVPILLPVAHWESQLAGEKMECLCDNSAIVWAINRATAKDPKLLRLLCSLSLFCATYSIFLVCDACQASKIL